MTAAGWINCSTSEPRLHALRTWLYSITGLLLVGALALGLAYHYREHIPMRWITAVRMALANVHVDHDTGIEMRDGTRLAGTLYLPRGAKRPLPTVYLRLPYGRDDYNSALGGAALFASRGYAVLVQDIRGTGDSQGTFVPYRGSTSDGAATLDWIARQPWSNGKVGTFGCSALGELQFTLARARHPAHVAMIAQGAGGGIGSAQGQYAYFGGFEGGIPELASIAAWFAKHGSKDPHAPPLRGFDTAKALWGLPVDQIVRRARPGANGFDDYLRTPLADPAWAKLDFVSSSDRLRTPALVFNTWGDQTIGGTLALAQFTRDHAPPGAPVEQHLVLAPGPHCDPIDGEGMFGELPVHNAQLPYKDLFLRWFDYWLRGQGEGLRDQPVYRFFVLRENRWLSSQDWPPKAARMQRWYLDSGGKANGRDGDGVLRLEPAPAPGLDTYAYDPANPVPSRGGPICCTGNPDELIGPADQRDVETRKDVLVYTSAPLSKSLRIVGPLRAHLRVSSSAPDTDFVARLVDVAPDGSTLSIQEGALRARYRDGFEHPILMQPGQSYALDVDMRSIAWQLPAGHRLRLDVTSSSFPRLERNLNTGGRNHDESVGVVARNSVHLGGADPSWLELPVLALHGDE